MLEKKDDLYIQLGMCPIVLRGNNQKIQRVLEESQLMWNVIFICGWGQT